jgi:hypothetical protein
VHRDSSYHTETPATTPRLQLPHRGPSYHTEAPANFSTQTVEYYTEVPKYYSATIYTAPQLRRSSITHPRLTTQKLLLPTTLNRNPTLMLQFTTPKPTLHLATTPKPPSTTSKKHHITQPRTLSHFSTPRNFSITLLQATTKLRLVIIKPLLTLILPIHRSCKVFLCLEVLHY